MRRIVLLLVLVLASVLVGCGGTPAPTARPTVPPTPTPGCDSVAAAAFDDELDLLLGEWDDTATLAGSTGRIALSPVVQQMQDIRRRVQALDAPCKEAEDVRAVAGTYMEFVTSAYLSFMSQEPDAEVKARFGQADDAFEEFKVQYRKFAVYLPE
jgi:hypothetical protein